jgi:SAM-dependent methyltransferase
MIATITGSIVGQAASDVILPALGDRFMDEDLTPYERFEQRYAEGRIPWDDVEPPPEIKAAVAELPAGRALDLGCGYGRAAIYLARHGWEVDGVDFIPRAIEVARSRAEEAGVGERAHFHVGSAAELGHLDPPYHLAVDVGCMHSFDEETLAVYRDELSRLLAPDALYMLFVHLRDERDEPGRDDGPRGIAEEAVRALFADAFRLERFEEGLTQAEDRPPWRSCWFWYRRLP